MSQVSSADRDELIKVATPLYLADLRSDVSGSSAVDLCQSPEEGVSPSSDADTPAISPSTPNNFGGKWQSPEVKNGAAEGGPRLMAKPGMGAELAVMSMSPV